MTNDKSNFINSKILNSIKTLRGDIAPEELKNKKVLLRVDVNVPIRGNGKIDDNEDWRIKAVLPTIKYLLKQKAKIILLAHLGRPKISRKFIKPNVYKVENSEYSLRPVANRMEELLKTEIKFVDDCIGESAEKAVREMKKEEVILLENLRFYAEEKENDDNFSKKLAALGDIYINDAFSSSHRSHASIVGIPKFLPSYAGFLLEKEIRLMKKAIEPKHPATAIVGGAKLETKLPVIESLAKIYDYVLVGGKIANEIIASPERYAIGVNVVLPDEKAVLEKEGFDIGGVSVKRFAELIEKAKTIVWNGPMGKFEEEEYNIGTRGIIKAIKFAREKGATVLIGGGETINAMQCFAPEMMDEKIDGFNISTGGGAMLASLAQGRSGLEVLAGKDLPGIEALRNSK